LRIRSGTHAPIRGLVAPILRVIEQVCVLWLVFASSSVRAEELSVRQRGWNGLSKLLELARADGPVLTPDQIDVEGLGMTDALLIVHPTAPLPNAELANFLRRGGRLAVADDFGTGRGLFAVFGMGLHEPATAGLHTLRGNPALPVASPVVGHALADGVDALVTNHPQVLHHRLLAPIFSLSGEQGAVVLSGAVGQGRLIAISDASVFINNMLEFRGNRVFARNLLHFLRGSAAQSRLTIADSDTRWQAGLRKFATDHPLTRLSGALSRVAKPHLPPLAVVALSIALAGLLLSAAATSLPRRSAYARRAYLQSEEVPAGMAGRVSHYATADRNLLGPLLVLKRELEHRMVAVARIAGQPQRQQVLQTLREQGVGVATVDELAELLRAVDRLEETALAAPSTKVSARLFSELVTSGRRILAVLDAASPQTHAQHP
jgi:hypothetical protein